MTAVLPLPVLLLLNENSTWNITRPQTEARPRVAHTACAAAAEKTGKPGRSAELCVYALAYRIGLWRSKPENRRYPLALSYKPKEISSPPILYSDSVPELPE